MSLQILAYYKALLFISLFWVIIFNLAGLYKFQDDHAVRVDNLFSISFGVLSAAFFNYIFVAYLYCEASYSRQVVIAATVLALLLVNLTRYLIWRVFVVISSKRS